jgi:hypothetical protein
MVNIDSLGLGAPQVATNFSSQKLTLRAEELARAMEMPFAKGPINSADSDSSSFINRKIPALTIHGLAGDFAHILHSDKDKAEKVNPQSLYLGYRLALALIYRLDEAACDASRD